MFLVSQRKCWYHALIFGQSRLHAVIFGEAIHYTLNNAFTPIFSQLRLHTQKRSITPSRPLPTGRIFENASLCCNVVVDVRQFRMTKIWFGLRICPSVSYKLNYLMSSLHILHDCHCKYVVCFDSACKITVDFWRYINKSSLRRCLVSLVFILFSFFIRNTLIVSILKLPVFKVFQFVINYHRGVSPKRKILDKSFEKN